MENSIKMDDLGVPPLMEARHMSKSAKRCCQSNPPEPLHMELMSLAGSDRHVHCSHRKSSIAKRFMRTVKYLSTIPPTNCIYPRIYPETSEEVQIHVEA